MASTNETYTYRGGEKLPLTKSANEFVVRASPERFETLGIAETEKLSPSSSKVTTTAGELDAMMAQAENVAVTQPAYYEADSGQEFLATDRILVSFREALAPEKIDEFAGRYGLVMKETYSARDYLFQLTAHAGMDAVALVVELAENEPLVESAWRILDNFGSFDVAIGVTDDGCKLSHPDFDSPGKFAGWGYFRGNCLIVREAADANPAEMHKTGANHGTACAGVIAGEADAVLTVGAAPDCRLLADPVGIRRSNLVHQRFQAIGCHQLYGGQGGRNFQLLGQQPNQLVCDDRREPHRGSGDFGRAAWPWYCVPVCGGK